MIIAQMVVEVLGAVASAAVLAILWQQARRRRKLERRFKDRMRAGSITVLPRDREAG